MATFVVTSNLNVTVSVIKNVLDDMQFVYVINMTILFCPLVNMSTLTTTVIHCDTPDGSNKNARY